MYEYEYGLSEEELAIQQVAREFAQREVKPVAAQLNEAGEFSWKLFRRMGELGLLNILVPEQYGGLGMSVTSFLLVLEELGRVCASTATCYQVHCGMTELIATLGTDEQKQRYLPKLGSGQLLGATALTEPQAGSDLAALSSSVKLVGDQWVINGRKQFISNGGQADVYVVALRTGPERHDGISQFIVEKGAPGFGTGRVEKKMGLRASPTAELLFEDCRVPADALLGPIERGFVQAEQVLNFARLGAAMVAIGISQTAMDESLKYAMDRKQFDQRIYDFQSIQFMIADMATRIHSSRLLVFHAARKREAGKDVRREIAMAKCFATDAAMQTTVDAVQVFGGNGYMEDYPVERLMRDAKIWQIVDGTNQIQRVIIGKSLARHGV